MKKWNILIFALAIVGLSGCSVISGIFKAGVFVGVLAVIAVIGIIIWIFSQFNSG
jgi:hypothetical protein